MVLVGYSPAETVSRRFGGTDQGVPRQPPGLRSVGTLPGVYPLSHPPSDMNVRARVREHVAAVATAISAVSLALVFAAALRVVPAGRLPRAPSAVVEAIPHLNAAISVVALVVIVAGVRAIHQGNVERHRMLMGTAFGLFALFLVGYLYRVALVGPTPFPATGALETAYHVILGVHITLAIVCVPLLFYTLLLAWSHPIAEIPTTNHRRVGRIAAPLWAISFALGVVVYLLVYVVV